MEVGGLVVEEAISRGVGLEIIRSAGEPFIQDNAQWQLYMQVRKFSQDMFDALYRQRAGGQGQGHANQLNQKYEETKDQRQGPDKR
jgi:hypothetical protein